MTSQELNGQDRPQVRLWFVPIVLLVAVWLWLAFRSGGFLPRQWLAPALAVTAFVLAVTWLGAYPRRPGQLSLAILALLTTYGLWVVASAAWAGSVQQVWDEAGRTFLYILVLGVAFTYLTDQGARSAFRYLLLGGGLLLVLIVTYRLGTATDIELFFTGHRFSYPTSYPNNAAALYLVLFWPLLWIAADPLELPTFRGIALGTCTGLVGLAILTQSRGGLYALAASLVLVFLLSPVRLRTMFFLLAPGALAVWYFPRLNEYWSEGPTALGGGPAAQDIVVGALVAGAVGIVVAHLERWVRVSARMRLVFGVVVLVLAVALATAGAYRLESEVGDVPEWAKESWQRFRAEERVTLPTVELEKDGTSPSRFALVSASGRWDIWRVGWEAFLESPTLGVGAGNFVYEHERNRQSERAKPKQPHSLELRVLSETGIVGGTLFFGALILGLGGMFWPRFNAAWHGVVRRRGPGGLPDETRGGGREPPPRWHTDPKLYTWETYLAFGFLYWIIHGSVEWLWHMPGVSLPAFFMLALGVGWTDARAEVLWPRLSVALQRSRQLAVLLPLPSLLRRSGQSRESRGAGVEPQEGVSTESATRSDSTRPAADLTSKDGEIGGGTEGRVGSFGEGVFSPHRRSDRYAGRRRRRSRRDARRARLDVLLQPRGPLSVWFRRIALLLAAAVLVGLALPYISLRYEQLARANMGSAPSEAISQTRVAAALRPFAPGPVSLRARVHESIALSAAREHGSEATSEILDYLALALVAHETATEREPVAWQVHYHTGVATANLLAARLALETSPEDIGDDGEGSGEVETAQARNAGEDEPVAALSAVPGVSDWGGLLRADPPRDRSTDPSDRSPGLSSTESEGITLSTTASESEQRRAERLLILDRAELTRLARAYLQAARDRNPLSPEVALALASISRSNPEPPTGF